MSQQAHGVKELRALVELSGMVNSSLDIESVLGHAMTCVQELLDAEASSIFQLDAEKGELYFRLALGDAAERVREVRLGMGQGIAGWVARTRRPLIIPDTSKDPRFNAEVDVHSGFRTRSILCVPMIYRGRLTGVLQVLNKRSGREFTRDDLEILTVLSNQIATAIENARLYARLNERFTLTSCELRSTQEKLLHAERLAALGRLSQGVAHEVRNPVTVIGGFARRLKKELAASESAQRGLDVILAEAERLERMVTDIEDFCKLPAPSPGEVDLARLLERVLQSFSDWMNRQSIAAEVLSDGLAYHAWADEKLLEIACRNVIQNSIEAMPEGGRIEIELKTVDNGLALRFRDTGSGIPPESLPYVFEPFYTSRTRGSGLGLTRVHRIVCDHGGDVNIASVVGKGTEVLITLPMAPHEGGQGSGSAPGGDVEASRSEG
ncbi:MAG: GAF domain-containing protein [Syntrophobacteraceae bacterium]|nr:GAF domain-containing protein [Syntrophobacteraceae bacterium]